MWAAGLHCTKKIVKYVLIKNFLIVEFRNRGFPDTVQTYGIVSGLWSSTFALGLFIGPSMGGALLHLFDFRTRTYYVLGSQIVMVSSSLSYAWAFFAVTFLESLMSYFSPTGYVGDCLYAGLRRHVNPRMKSKTRCEVTKNYNFVRVKNCGQK